MSILDLVKKGLLRSLARSLFFILIVLLSSALYGALVSLEEAAENQITGALSAQANRFVITPGTGQKTLSYAGIPIQGAVTYRGKDLPLETLAPLERYQAEGLIADIRPVSSQNVQAPGYTRIEARARDASALQQVMGELQQALPEAHIVAIWDVEAGRRELVDQIRVFRIFASLLTIVATGALVAAFANLAIRERMREIGLMRAIGFSRKALLGILLSELSVLTGIGAIAGALLGTWGSVAVVGLWVSGLIPTVSFGGVLAVVLPALLAAIIGGLTPGWRGVNIDPAFALRMY